VTVDPTPGEKPNTLAGRRAVSALVNAVQYLMRGCRSRGRRPVDETPYSRALTVELTWLSKSQREQLDALVPQERAPLPHNVVEFRSYFPDRVQHAPQPPPAPPAPKPRPTWHWPTAGVAALVMIALCASAWYLTTLSPSDYVSGTGERRVIHLDDGSTVTMNTQSRLRVWLTRQRRDIELVDGEALFAVAHDARRPFRVHVGRTIVEAVGTEFSVYRGQHGTKVAVVEGRVRIFAYQSPASLILNSNAVAWSDLGAADLQRPPPIPVSAREEAEVTGDGGSAAPFDVERRKVSALELEHDLAWVNGQLIFDDASLAETVEEFNRYNRRKLRIADPTLAQLRIGGAFRSTNIDDLIIELHDLFGVRAVPVGDPETGQVIQLKRERPGPP
jgi:transmembrane sensor